MKFKVVEYNIRNGPIQWQISTPIKVILKHFSVALIVFEIFRFQNCWPWKCRSRPWCTTFTVVPFDWLQMPDFISDGNFNICSFPTFTCQNILLKSLTLKTSKVKVMENNVHNGPIRWQISTSIKFIFEYFSACSHRFWAFHICKFITAPYCSQQDPQSQLLSDRAWHNFHQNDKQQYKPDSESCITETKCEQ